MGNVAANPSKWMQPTADDRFVTIAAEQGNLWKAFPVAAGGFSAATVVYHNTLAGIIYGHVSGATTLSLQVSADGSTWTTIASITLPGASDFAFTDVALPGGIQLMLVSSAAATITGTALF